LLEWNKIESINGVEERKRKLRCASLGAAYGNKKLLECKIIKSINGVKVGDR